VSLPPKFPVDELHGNRSQVVFSAAPPWTKTIARCELSDLCIVWFRRRPEPRARITFLQAKLSKDRHDLCVARSASISEDFIGDSTQWYLLHNRPTIVGRFQTFKPPTNLLSNALLPSVASFAVFHRNLDRCYNFFYASADTVISQTPSRPGKAKLKANGPALTATVKTYTEQKWACCPLIFGAALFEGLIGTPIDYDGIASPIDDAYRQEARRWLARCLATARQQQQVIGPVITSFLQTFDLVALDNQNSELPGRAMIFIRGDKEENPERL
ncbi:MAG TPA: hypothetical protein VMO75_04375, partial [Chthoniobacterales bacterium]|nr:hypothetical protein [Chthoniobacterales bacterium]